MIIPFNGKKPQIDKTAFVATNATVIGNVTISEECSVWYGAVLRGDSNRISIGPQTNIQDLSVLHVDDDHALTLGRGVSVGHRCILHGCTIDDDVLVGMGSTVMNSAFIGEGTLIGAGALVTEGTKIPPCSLVLGVPGKVKRSLTDKEIEGIKANAASYVVNCILYRKLGLSFDE